MDGKVDQETEIKEVFCLFSKGSASIAPRELGNVVRALGIQPCRASTDLISAREGQDAMTLKTLTAVIHEVLSLNQQAEKKSEEFAADSVFKLLDIDNKGIIKVAHLRQLLLTMSNSLSPEKIDAIFSGLGLSAAEPVDMKKAERLQDLCRQACT